MPRRSINEPVDHVLARLHEAIDTPLRVSQVKLDALFWLNQVRNREHERFLEEKLREIEMAGTQPQRLQTIQDEIDAWNDREFPVDRKGR
jgi:hypothetical protein